MVTVAVPVMKIIGLVSCSCCSLPPNLSCAAMLLVKSLVTFSLAASWLMRFEAEMVSVPPIALSTLGESDSVANVKMVHTVEERGGG